MPDSLDPALCEVDTMCEDGREAESEKVCVNVRDRVSVQVSDIVMRAGSFVRACRARDIPSLRIRVQTFS